MSSEVYYDTPPNGEDIDGSGFLASREHCTQQQPTKIYELELLDEDVLPQLIGGLNKKSKMSKKSKRSKKSKKVRKSKKSNKARKSKKARK